MIQTGLPCWVALAEPVCLSGPDWGGQWSLSVSVYSVQHPGD